MLFSYIIPSYNPVPEILEETITSVFRDCASFGITEFEVIVVDDASSSDLNGLYHHMASRYPNLRILYNKNNVGMGATINAGIKEARGRYIFRLDADDLNLPGRTEQQLKLFRSSSCAFQATGAVEFEHGDPSQKYVVDSFLGPIFFKEALKYGLPCHHSSFAFDTHAIKSDLIYCDRSSDFGLIEDYELIMRLFLSGFNFQYCKGAWIQYRKLEGSLSSQKIEILKLQREKLKNLHYHDLNTNSVFTMLLEGSRIGFDKRKTYLIWRKLREF